MNAVFSVKGILRKSYAKIKFGTLLLRIECPGLGFTEADAVKWRGVGEIIAVGLADR